MGRVLKNENIRKVRVNKRDAIDQIRVALWYSHIQHRLDEYLPSQIARIIEPDKIRVVDGCVTDNDRKWRNYKNGLNVPHPKLIDKASVHDKFHRTLVLSGFFFLKIASTFLISSFFPKSIKLIISI